MQTKHIATKEQKALRNYIGYIHRRLSYIELGSLQTEANEYYFYKDLYSAIRSWRAANPIVYRALILGYDYMATMNALNIKTQSTYNHYLKMKTDELINYIFRKEAQLSAKYPFNENSAYFSVR